MADDYAALAKQVALTPQEYARGAGSPLDPRDTLDAEIARAPSALARNVLLQERARLQATGEIAPPMGAVPASYQLPGNAAAAPKAFVMPDFDAILAAHYGDNKPAPGIVDHIAQVYNDPDGGLVPAVGAALTHILPEGGGTRGVTGLAEDSAIDLAKGVVGIGQSVVGIGNLVTFGQLGKQLRDAGYDANAANQMLSGFYSADRQIADKDVADAKGFLGTVASLTTHPSALLGQVVESVPGFLGMSAGAGVALRLMLPKAAAAAEAAGATGDAAAKFITDYIAKRTLPAAGEVGAKEFGNTLAGAATGGASAVAGLQTAGQVADAGENAGTDFSTYAPAALGAGAATALAMIGTAHIADRLGFNTLYTAIAKKALGDTAADAAAPQMGRLAQAGAGAIDQGLGNAAMAAAGGVGTNVATGKPWDQDLGAQVGAGATMGVALGGLTGLAMGKHPAQAKLEDVLDPNKSIDDSIAAAADVARPHTDLQAANAEIDPAMAAYLNETGAPPPPSTADLARLIMLGKQADMWQAHDEADEERIAAGPAPDPDAVISALQTIPALRTAEQRVQVTAARDRYSPDEMSAVEKQANSPFLMTPEEKLQVQGLRENQAPEAPLSDLLPRTAEEMAKPVSEAPTEMPGIQRSPQRQILDEQGLAEVNPTALPNDASQGMSRGMHGLVKRIAAAFGKKVVIYSGEGGDGFYDPRTPDTVYLNQSASKPHLYTLGHEIVHALANDAPDLYKALETAVTGKMAPGAEEEHAKDYGPNANRQEMVADLVGNRMSEGEFWDGVFGKMDKPTVVKLTQKVLNAIDLAKKAIGGAKGFAVDKMVADLDGVRTAVQKAMSSYMERQRGAAKDLVNSGELSEKQPLLSDRPAEQPRDVGGRFKEWEAEDELRLSPTRNNASGESSASLEAQNRAKREQDLGQKRVLVERDGSTVRPLYGVDAADQRAGPGQVILQRGVGKTEWTVLESGQGVTKGAEARAIDAARRRASPARETPEYGEPTADSVSVTGVHYSQQPRKALFTNYAGTGMKGADLARIERDNGERLRSYFYVDKGKGVIPEDGVGGYAHETRLHNLYDADADPLHLAEDSKGPTQFEHAVTQNGYNGYYRHSFRTDVGAATVLGQHEIPTKLVGQGNRPPNGTLPMRSAPPERTGWRKDVSDLTTNKQLPGGELSGARWGPAIEKADPALYGRLDKAGLFDAIADKGPMYKDALAKAYKDLQVQRSPARPDEGLDDAQRGIYIGRYFEHSAGPPETRFKRKEDVAAMLQANTLRALGGKPLTEFSDDNRKFLASIMAAEGDRALRRSDHAGEWYKKNLQEALQSAAELHPEIATDPDKRFVFTVALAITSNGTAIEDNTRMAFEVYRYFEKNGRFPLRVTGGGDRAATMIQHFGLFNRMLKASDLASTREALLKQWNVKDLREASGKDVSGLADEMVYGGALFGPKLGGAFLQNLNGNFEPLTMDRWLSRTWGRYTGNLLDARGNLRDSPTSDGQRAFMRKVAADALADLRARGYKIDTADLQAALWFPEKILYNTYGREAKRAMPTDYATEAKKYVQEHADRKSGAGQEPGRRAAGDGRPEGGLPAGDEGGAAPGADAEGLQEQAGIRRSPERLAESYRQNQGTDLEGLPRDTEIPGVGKVDFHAFKPAQDAAAKYAADRGMDYRPPKRYAKVDPQRATRIADAYEAMEHNPDDPDVKAAYGALAAEMKAQYRSVLDTGLKVDFMKPGEPDPYAASPRLAIMDVVNNNHMSIYSTREGFGSADSPFDASASPMLADSGFRIGGEPALINDIFRVVHDYYGHIKDGVGFRADGEENAWRSHAAMFSPLARRALTTETRGQNSWVNFGPFGKENRTAGGADTRYADQKVGLLPAWASEEGRADPLRSPQREADADLVDLRKRVSILQSLKECLA